LILLDFSQEGEEETYSGTQTGTQFRPNYTYFFIYHSIISLLLSDIR
jgi:hypothetical protein